MNSSFHTPHAAHCTFCGCLKQDFVWEGTVLSCTDCASPSKTDWHAISLQLTLGYRPCGGCGKERRHFIADLCLRCTSRKNAQQAADNLIASGPWDLVTD